WRRGGGPTSNFVLAVPHGAVTRVADTVGRGDGWPMSYPAIGMAGPTVVIAFQALMAETSSAGYNYGEIFLTASTDGGTTWLRPGNVSSTLSLDERYPSMSKWNTRGWASMVYHRKQQPGMPGLVRQVFSTRPVPFGVSVDAESDVPALFALYQNYPNPFNPTTTIHYSLPPGVGTLHATSLRVYDVLGREVATLVNEAKQPGTYTVQWDASNIPSGVYFYRLKAGEFKSTRKLLILR
ncbi:MAG: T9SS type A sorting domain-containing protein, partial [Bacteroidota bacterium]